MNNEIVFVTGSNKGLGLGIVELLLREKYKVIAGIHHKSEKIELLKKEFKDLLYVVKINVASEYSVKKAYKKVARKVKHIDIIINNAGIHPKESFNPLEKIKIKSMKKVLAVNAIGPLIVLKHFIPLLFKGKRKLIVNISSEAGSISTCWRKAEYDYCMSKAALNMASRILQNYLKDNGVKVLAIHPGWVRTDMGGPDAEVSVEESAHGIFKLLKKEWQLNDEIYFDYKGNKMEW